VKLLLVILVCVLAFPFGYHKNIAVREGYTNKLSVIKGDSITVYLDCKEKHRKGQFLLYDIHYNAIDSAIASCNEQKINTLKPWGEGFGYNPTIGYPTNKLKSGIYFWYKFIPFIVTEKKKCDITLVIPLMNIHGRYRRVGLRSARNRSSPLSVSFERRRALKPRPGSSLEGRFMSVIVSQPRRGCSMSPANCGRGQRNQTTPRSCRLKRSPLRIVWRW